MKVSIWLTVAMLLLASANLHAAPDLSDPKSAAQAFDTAINAGDAAGAKATSIGTDSQIAAATALADNVAAEKKLSDAARAKFGDDSAKIVAKPDFKRFRFPLDKPELIVTVDGDAAQLTLPNRSKPIMTLKQIDGSWKVDIGSISFFATDPGNIAIVEARSAKVKSDLAEEIAIGKYTSAEDAHRAMGEKLAKAEGKR